MKTEKHLFKLIDSLGEIFEGDLHIIDTTDTYGVEEEKNYRVYHISGICFDIKKEVEIENEKTGEPEKYEYSIYDEWDGFDNKKTIDQIFKLIKNYSKKYLKT